MMEREFLHRFNNHSPRPDAIRLVLKRRVEVLAAQVRAFAHDQAAVVGPIGQQIDQALQAAEARARAVLVLVRPGRVGRQVGAVGEAHVDGVEGDDQVLRLVDGFEGADDAGLGADGPGEGLVRQAVAGAHAFLVDDGEVAGVDGAGVVAVVA